MRFGFFRRNRIGEAHAPFGAIMVHESAGNRVHDAERLRVGRAAGLSGVTENFDRRWRREFFPGDGARRQSKQKFHAVAGLMSGEIGDRRRNWWRRRRWLTRSSATIRTQENGKQKMENGKGLRGAFFEVKCRPFSIFHFPISRIREYNGSDPGS